MIKMTFESSIGTVFEAEGEYWILIKIPAGYKLIAETAYLRHAEMLRYMDPDILIYDPNSNQFC